MIIKQTYPSTTFQFGKRFYLFLIGGLFLLISLVLAGKYIAWGSSTSVSSASAYCDAEEVKLKDGRLMFYNDGVFFDNAHTRTSEIARNGQYSSKIDSINTYGILYVLESAKAGERYQASVWRYGSKLELSNLAVSITEQDTISFYKQESSPVEVDKEEWERLELNFEIPSSYQKGLIKIYVYGANLPVYLDDFKVKRIADVVAKPANTDSLFQQISLRIDEKGMRKLETRRQHAISSGIYFAQDDDWVKGKLRTTDEEIPVKLRFKGDWMDHLVGDKWSFRIRVKEPHAWNRMLTFSIQRPETRDFLSEWVYHQWLTKEDLLSTRYDFVHVALNGEAKGIYAYEEHFEKHLPEFRSRREGPIVKFSEDGVWNARKRWLDLEQGAVEIEETLNSYEAANVLPFREGRTLGDSALASQFKQAHSLMLQYKFGQKSASEIFDLDKLAKYYVITDICQAYHSMVWHNQRFYFNPVLGKLEPIGYDGFTEDGIYRMTNDPFIGAAYSMPSGDYGDDMNRQVFGDSAFVSKYVQYLDAFTEKSYMEQFWMDLLPIFTPRLQLIQTEYPAYNYPSERLMDQAKRIRRLMYPLDNNSIRAFTGRQEETSQQVRLANYHILPLEVIGFGKQSDQLIDSLDKPIWLASYDRKDLPSYSEISVPLSSKVIFFRLPGTSTIYHSQIVPWNVAQPSTPVQDIWANADITQYEFLQIKGKQLYIPSGNYQVKKDILIPQGYQLHIASGVQLDMVNHAAFISRSPVYMYGSEEQPIKVFSSDHTAQGFSVIQAEEPSVLHYVSFENFNTLSRDGWQLTGAVSFYESEVEIDHCVFTNNHCEDALNLIRTNFELSHSLISYTYADGLDVDFCQGKISNLHCLETGNDGVDFSGSKVEISGCTLERLGDKGVSVGEESHLTLQNVTISQARLGMASKDLSKLYVDQVTLDRCNIGFAAYQKKAEYGGAYIEVKNYEANEVKHLHMIEEGSTLLLKGKVVDSL